MLSIEQRSVSQQLDALDVSRMSLLSVLALGAYVYLAAADLALPQPLTSIMGEAGQVRLLRSKYKSDFFELAEHFVAQENGAYCGVATAAMILNALGVPRPMQPEWSNPSYAYFTQDNIFNNDTEKVVAQAHVRQEGMSLEELAGFIAAHEGASSSFIHSDPRVVSLASFRTSILSALSLPQTYVAVNFDRQVLGEVGSGHHSPIGAYDSDTDSVLVLDVSRYKYPAFWVSVTALYEATTGKDNDIQRGLVFAFLSKSSFSTTGVMQVSQTDNGYNLSDDDDDSEQAVSMTVTGSNSNSNVGIVVGVSFATLAVGICVGAASMYFYNKRRSNYQPLHQGQSYPVSKLLTGGDLWSSRSSHSDEEAGLPPAKS